MIVIVCSQCLLGVESLSSSAQVCITFECHSVRRFGVNGLSRKRRRGKIRSMGLLVLLGLLQVASGFVRLDTTPQPPEASSRADLHNLSLPRLSSEYLKARYPDLSFLKISNSRIGRIDKDAFDHLRHLNLLEISSSEVSAEIDADTFSRLPGLEILILSNVHLRRLNLNLTHVQQLILARNDIGSIEGASLVARDVSYLDLSGNRLTALEGSFANLSKLSMIDVSRNRIAEVGAAFEENVNLLRILASENAIASTEGLRLPWLRNLDLFSNRIQALDSSSFPKMAALEELVLAFNDISHIDDAFRDLLELKYLNLAWNHIDRLHPDLFRNNLYLTDLSLQGNAIKSLQRFRATLHHLARLDLSHNLLALLDDDFFASTPSLQQLDLSFNRLKALADALAPLPQLQALNLAYNQLSLAGHELSTNRQLLRLNLSSNALEGGVAHFKDNQLLRDLDVSGNRIAAFCEGEVVLRSLVRLNLRGNLLTRLGCLRHFNALCEVDVRHNPLTCGEDLDDVLLTLAERRRSPEEQDADDECENLSLNGSLALWNSVKRELCPGGRDLHPSAPEGHPSAAPDTPHTPPDHPTPSKKQFLVVPIGWIGNDEMNKPNPLQSPQSERTSWERIEDNAELLKDLEEEEPARRRFSWYTIALILIGLSLSLTCFNLVVFFYIRLKVWKRADASSPQKYTILHNEVYKNTTEPTKVATTADSEWLPDNHVQNKIFSYGKINEFLLNFGLPKKDKDSESAKNVLISPNGPLNC